MLESHNTVHPFLLPAKTNCLAYMTFRRQYLAQKVLPSHVSWIWIINGFGCASAEPIAFCLTITVILYELPHISSKNSVRRWGRLRKSELGAKSIMCYGTVKSSLSTAQVRHYYSSAMVTRRIVALLLGLVVSLLVCMMVRMEAIASCRICHGPIKTGLRRTNSSPPAQRQNLPRRTSEARVQVM